MKSKFTWCNSSSASSCMLFQVRSQWCIYGTSARLIQGAPDHPWREPLCSPSTTPYPSKYLGVQVDLFKSNPAASTDPVTLYLLSPGVTNLGLGPKKNSTLLWDNAVILWGTLSSLGSVLLQYIRNENLKYFHKTNWWEKCNILSDFALQTTLSLTVTDESK